MSRQLEKPRAKAAKQLVVESEDDDSIDELDVDEEVVQPKSKAKNNAKNTNKKSTAQVAAASKQDPASERAERRKLRQSYRMIIENTTVNKHEFIQPESDKLIQALQTADELFANVKMPREAALDTEFMGLASKLGAEQISKLQTGFRSYNIYDYVLKLRAMLSVAELGADQDAADMQLDWTKLEKSVRPVYKTIPPASFMYGTLSLEIPQKKKKARTVREKLAAKVTPEDVVDTEKDRESETSKRVAHIGSLLQKTGKINFWKFVTDPTSFGRTVENIFHFAFLIKDGYAKITKDDEGAHIAEPWHQPTQADYASESATRKQGVLALDYQTWEKVVAKYNITKAIIPPPPVNPYNRPYASAFNNASQSSQNGTLSTQNKSTAKQQVSDEDVEELDAEDEEEEVDILTPKSNTNKKAPSKKKKKTKEQESISASADEDERPKTQVSRKRKAAVIEDEEESEEEQPKRRKRG
jgi:hypothetical protein